LNINTNESGSLLNSTAWILKNGTVIAFSFSGQNLTGTQANGIFFGFMFPFALELQFNNYLGPFTTAAGVHQVSTGTTTITGTPLSVTNYAASSLPLNISACGSSFVLTAFMMQTGKVQGVSIPLITQFHITGTSKTAGQQGTEDFSFYIIAITKG
jgi:hypothetical protein